MEVGIQRIVLSTQQRSQTLQLQPQAGTLLDWVGETRTFSQGKAPHKHIGWTGYPVVHKSVASARWTLYQPAFVSFEVLGVPRFSS